MLQSVPPTHHTPGRLGAPAGRLPAAAPAALTQPLPPVAEAQLASLCTGLKAVGRQLEPAHAAWLDLLQERLTELCQGPGLPVQSPSGCSCSRCGALHSLHGTVSSNA